MELLSAPEWPRVPDGLRRADGESVFRPHGAERYASQAQLTLEERLLAQAQEPGAPHLDRAVGGAAARRGRGAAPGAAPARAGHQRRRPESTGSGLRMDQAAAAWYVLTSPRRAEVMVGPAGTGKTRTAIEMARAWQQAGIGPVVALTASSNARNVLRDEAARHGVTGLACYNTAEWLGHAKGAREARTPVDLAPGTLITLDEASMTSLPDLAAVLRRAAQHGAKIVVTGDPVQLQAVEGGGGMALLARQPRPRPAGRGQPVHPRLGTPGHAAAARRRRDRPHRLPAARPAARRHGRGHAGGRGPRLPARPAQRQGHPADGRNRRPGRRTVPPGPRRPDPVGHRQRRPHHPAPRRRPRLRRRLDHGPQERQLMSRQTGQRGRNSPTGTYCASSALTLMDVGCRCEVERLTGRDEAGRQQWSAPFDLSRTYLSSKTHLAYAVTFHAAEGRTVDSGIAVFTGEEDRQAVYVAMSRGRDSNEAYVIAGWRIADPQPGPEPAPELARQERLDREHAGLDTGQDRRREEDGTNQE